MKKAILAVVFVGLIAGFLPSCQSPKEENSTQDSTGKTGKFTFFSERDHSEMHFDSSLLAPFFVDNPTYRPVSKAVSSFYRDREFQFAWMSEGRLNDAAFNFYNQLQSHISDQGDSSIFDPVLDSLMILIQEDESAPIKPKEMAETIEIRLTASFFKYADIEYSGKVKNVRTLDWFIPRKKKNLVTLLDSLISGRAGLDLQEPANRYYQSLKSKLREYRELEKSGRWPVYSEPFRQIAPGSQDTLIPAIKMILRLSGQGLESDSSPIFTPEMGSALVLFQKRMGLAETGKLNKATWVELQIPINQRIRQILVNMERMRWLPDSIGQNLILVNIPAFKMYVFENGYPEWSSNVVVGKEGGKTHVFTGNISHIVFNPFWTVPPGIIRREVLPGLKKNPNYLRKHQMDVYQGDTKISSSHINWNKYQSKIPYKIRQRPGPENPLGRMKFLLPNSFYIYLHDSPQKYLYNENSRAFSHGCIRVEKARKLADFLLRSNPTMTPENVDRLLAKKKEVYVKISPTMPVFIVYLTAWVSESGQLNFRPDIYNRDEPLSKAIFGE